MAFEKELHGCFGNSDLIFAGHPADENRAFAWLVSLRQRGLGWSEAKRQMTEFLQSKQASPAHIDQQLRKWEPAMKPWLLD